MVAKGGERGLSWVLFFTLKFTDTYHLAEPFQFEYSQLFILSPGELRSKKHKENFFFKIKQMAKNK